MVRTPDGRMTLSQQVAQLEQQNVQQRDTIVRLTARIRFLEELTNNPSTDCWLRFGLNSQERTIAVLLLAQDLVPRDRILSALHGGQREVDGKIVEVLVSRLRKRMPKGVTIKNQKKLGWFMSDESKRILKNAMAERTPSPALVPMENI